MSMNGTGANGLSAPGVTPTFAQLVDAGRNLAYKLADAIVVAERIAMRTGGWPPEVTSNLREQDAQINPPTAPLIELDVLARKNHDRVQMLLEILSHFEAVLLGEEAAVPEANETGRPYPDELRQPPGKLRAY